MHIADNPLRALPVFGAAVAAIDLQKHQGNSENKIASTNASKTANTDIILSHLFVSLLSIDFVRNCLPILPEIFW
jgi:hypothetical protein